MLIKKAFLFLILSFFVGNSFAQEDIDYLKLSQILIKDGHYNRAEKTLDKLNEKEVENLALFYSLQGMLFLHKDQYEKSLKKFNKSLAQGLKEKEIYLYMAESYLKLGQLSEAQSTLEKLGLEDKQKLPYHLVKAEIFWLQGARQETWQILISAQSKGLSLNVINKKKFYYLIKEGLYQSAFSIAFVMIENQDLFLDVLAMASQLRVHKQYKLSLKLLQHLKILRPGHETVALEMAQNYLALKNPFSAALILEQAAHINPSLAYEAVEILRQVGKNYRARFLSLLITDPSLRLKQQLALYLAEDDYFSLTFMVPQLQRYKMLEDQKIRYAVAYSFFKTGHFKKSANYLSTIDQDGLFEKSIELKKEIINCQQEKWACRETI